MTALEVLHVNDPQDLPAAPSDLCAAASKGRSFFLQLSEAKPEKSTAKRKVNNTVVATACAAFSGRQEMSATASPSPFNAGETGGGQHGDDDGVRVRLKFTVNFMVHLGTYVNGVYHPKGICNGRRVFCRGLGGGGCPHLFLYYLPERDSWVVGMYPGDADTVYAVCGPAGDAPLTQPWQVWDGKVWVEDPPTAASVMYKCDQQTARWEDQAVAHHSLAAVKKAQHEIRHKMYKYAERGALRPLLEKGGILQDHALVVATDLAFEADRMLQDEPCRKMAWDVKIIDADNDGIRFKAEDRSPSGVIEACRQWYKAYNNRETRCAAERSWKYEPLVFTAQGHISPQAEAVISLLAVAVSQVEPLDAGKVRGEIMRSIIASMP